MDRRNPRTATTAIFVHGAGGGGWEWAIWQRVFAARGWNVLAPDLIAGAGGIAQTQLEDYSTQVRAWCAATAAPRVLIGASLGGLLALMLAAPAQAAALVLVNPLPAAGFVQGIRPEYPDVIPWGRARSLAGTRAAMPDADDAACLHALRRWRDESGAVMRAAALGMSVAAPDCATLILASELDTDVPPATSRAMAERIGAEFRLLPGASHVGPLLGRTAADTAASAFDWCAATLCDKV